jgi:hypothetical protein
MINSAVRTDHNRGNPATEYDHRITASTFLPFSGVFLPERTTFQRVRARNPRNRGPESLSWVKIEDKKSFLYILKY